MTAPFSSFEVQQLVGNFSSVTSEMSGYGAIDILVFNRLALQLTLVNSPRVGQTSSSIFIKFPNDVTSISNPSTFPFPPSSLISSVEDVKNLAA